MLPITDADFSPKKVPRRLAKDSGSHITFPAISVHLWTAVTVHEWSGGYVTSLFLRQAQLCTLSHKYKNFLFGYVILHTRIQTFDIKCITELCWHKNCLTSTNIYLTANYDKIDRDVSHSKAGRKSRTDSFATIQYAGSVTGSHLVAVAVTSNHQHKMADTKDLWHSRMWCFISLCCQVTRSSYPLHWTDRTSYRDKSRNGSKTKLDVSMQRGNNIATYSCLNILYENSVIIINFSKYYSNDSLWNKLLWQ